MGFARHLRRDPLPGILGPPRPTPRQRLGVPQPLTRAAPPHSAKQAQRPLAAAPTLQVIYLALRRSIIIHARQVAKEEAQAALLWGQ